MDEKIDGPLGLHILYPGLNPTVEYVTRLDILDALYADSLVSIVAVHGLGANPAWAWVWKEKGEHGELIRKVNWLQDLLPGKIPYARIMTFNYESKWHKDAPKQSRSNCAELLLTNLHDQRVEVSTALL
jgi:hypothetical protein